MSRVGVEVLAVVPARGGSKGIPRKNLAMFRGKPLIQYTLEAVGSSSSVGRVIVSTDDDEIRGFCEALGYVTSYRRSAELASDTAPMIDVVLDVLTWVEEDEGRLPDLVLLLQPTSPLRTSDDIDGLVRAVQMASAECMVSAHPMREHPMECIRLGESGDWTYLVDPPVDSHGRQAYGGTFLYINGAMYAASPDFLRRHRAFVLPGPMTKFFVMAESHGLDIDEPSDLDR